MSLTSRQRRPIDRGQIEFRDARLFIIATEGEITERKYFEMFRSTRIQIEILHTEGGASAPQAVLDRLNQYKAKYDLHDGDSLFLVIDRDRWPTQALKDVAQKCNDKGYLLAVSNPCFEIWIFLHFSNLLGEKATCDEFDAGIRELRGEFNKHNLKPEWFDRDTVKHAIAAAKALDLKPEDRWPQALGTRVYQVVESILDQSELVGES